MSAYPDWPQETIEKLAQGKVPAAEIVVPHVPLSADQVAALQEKVVAYIENFTWGTYGPDGDEPLKKRPLALLATDHLEAILITQPQIGPGYRAAILHILKERYQQ